MDEIKDELRPHIEAVVQATADAFLDQHCVLMCRAQQDYWYHVIFDHTLTALIAYEELRPRMVVATMPSAN